MCVALLLAYGFLMHAKLLFRPVRNPAFVTLDEAIDKFGPDEEVVGAGDEAEAGEGQGGGQSDVERSATQDDAFEPVPRRRYP